MQVIVISPDFSQVLKVEGDTVNDAIANLSVNLYGDWSVYEREGNKDLTFIGQVNYLAEYHHIEDFSMEMIYVYEFLALKLSQSYGNWQEMLGEYKYYGDSVTPAHHVFKYKGNLTNLHEDDENYEDIPFSALYKENPVKACTPLTKDEWIAIVEQKKRENTNPFWNIYEELFW